MTRRTPSHAGSWYTADKAQLHGELDSWLAAVPDSLLTLPSPLRGSDRSTKELGTVPVPGARLIIAPHAGYSYSGPTAAWAYKSWDLSKAKRVFVLGPSHHKHLDSCALSKCDTYGTPLGDLPLDKEMLEELHGTGRFVWMSTSTDEDEHSLEMHLPYVYKMIERAGKLDTVKVVPIMVGSISVAKEKAYGKLLAPYLADPENCFVVSSDFCHWGSRFHYTLYYLELPSIDDPFASGKGQGLRRGDDPEGVDIWESIEALDHQGMAAVETGAHDTFAAYLRRTENTICGRHPIGVVMAGIESLEGLPAEDDDAGGRGRFRFVRYEQSNRARDPTDSSVSYASAFAVL